MPTEAHAPTRGARASCAFYPTPEPHRMATLLSSHTTNTSGTAVDLPLFEGNADRPYLYSIFVWGTFGGGTVQIEVTPDGTEWINVSGLAFTAEGVQNMEVNATQVRATVSGSTAASINAVIL